MNRPRPQRPLLLSPAVMALLLVPYAACGDDAGVRLAQPNLPDAVNLTPGAFDVVPTDTDTPPPVDGVVGEDGVVVPPADTTPPSDTTPPGDVISPTDTTPTDTTPPGDVISPTDTTPTDTTPPGDTVGPSDTGGPDVPPVPCTEDGECLDNPPCGLGACVNGFCDFEATNNGQTCDDGDPCTTSDACSEGRCLGFGRLTCDDNSACTVDLCVAGVGCVAEPIDCGDANACTTASCDPTRGCVYTPISCPVPGDACSLPYCDPVLGCVTAAAADRTPCDDGNPCTSEGFCLGGVCTGGPSTCDDGNPCTSDSCTPSGQCAFAPIPNCVFDPACEGRIAGESCDDGNPDTVADMCIAGRCAGYVQKRLPGNTVSNYQGLVIREVDHGPDGWSAIFWSARVTATFQTILAWSLARITDPSNPFVHGATTTTQGWYGELNDGFAIRSGRNITAFANGSWSTGNGFNAAVVDERLDGATALFTRRDRASNGQPGTRRMWVGGHDGGEGLVLYCVQGQDGVSCDTQWLEAPEPGPIPMALAGTPICTDSGACTGAWMGVATDFDAEEIGAEGWFLDTYVNPTGVAEEWEAGDIPADTTDSETWSMVAWGASSAPRMLVVGSAGHLNAMTGPNEWSGAFFVREGQEARTFTGVTVVDDTVIVSATRFSGDDAIYELWTVPAGASLTSGVSWNVHELLRAPDVDSAGLYDVHGRAGGEVMAVGAVRRVTINGTVNWLDGLVYWRQAP
jgi:hypothetical protein